MDDRNIFLDSLKVNDNDDIQKEDINISIRLGDIERLLGDINGICSSIDYTFNLSDVQIKKEDKSKVYKIKEEITKIYEHLDYFAFNTVDNDVDVSAKQIRELSSNLNKLNELIAGLGNNKVQEIQDKINEAKTKVAAMEGKTRRNEDGYSIDEGHFI